LRGLAVARAIVRFSTPWAPREFWSDVETKRCHAARNRRLAFAETDLSHVLACLCWHRLGARPGLLDFNEVSAAADVHFSALTTAALGFRASQRRGYGPLLLGVIAAAMILAGKFYFDVTQPVYPGVGLLIAASIWNGWPRRAIPACSECVQIDFDTGERIHETNN